MWLKAFKSDEVRPGHARCFSHARVRIGIFRTETGLFAVHNTCPHFDADLHFGEVKDGMVYCPWHHWRFHLESGFCETGERYDIAVYPIKEEAGYIWVDPEAGSIHERPTCDGETYSS